VSSGRSIRRIADRHTISAIILSSKIVVPSTVNYLAARNGEDFAGHPVHHVAKPDLTTIRGDVDLEVQHHT
jgi:hypothetical protein